MKAPSPSFALGRREGLGPATRNRSLERFSTDRFDVCVVGGGIAGAGAALDAAARGLSVAMIDAGDFASGTSGRSSELIHGGLRYLASGDVRLCRESVRERDLVRRLAPHLVRPLLFVLPLPADRSSVEVRLGLSVYDALAGPGRPGRHTTIDPAGRMELAGPFRWEFVRGAWGYWDAQTSDARLVLEVVRAADRWGAAVAPYVRAVGLETSARRACLLPIVDELSGHEGEIRARCVVNATGVWGGGTGLFAGHGVPRIRPSKGAHLVLSRSVLPLGAACVFPSGDGRSLFAVPDHDVVVVGTTDTEGEHDVDAVSVEPDDVAYLVGALEANFDVALRPEHIVGAWAGLRPLLAGDARATRDLSRRHRVSVSTTGVVSLAGGKLTTYRHGAERAVDAVCTLLEERRPSKTAHIPLGCEIPPERLALRLCARAQRLGVDLQMLRGLVGRHGDRTPAVLDLIDEDPSLAQPLGCKEGALLADGVWAVRNELAFRLGDVLDRRLRLATKTAGAGLDRRMVTRLAAELGWDERRLRSELRMFRRSIARERGPVAPLPPMPPDGTISGLRPSL